MEEMASGAVEFTTSFSALIRVAKSLVLCEVLSQPFFLGLSYVFLWSYCSSELVRNDMVVKEHERLTLHLVLI